MWQPKPGARAGSPTEQRRRRPGWGWDRSGWRCGYGAASRRGKRARGCRRSTMARCPLAGRRPVPEWTWTRPERRRPGATGQMAQKGRKACRPHGSGDCDGSPAGAETAGQQRGSPVSAGCPRQPGRRACPCGIAGWDAYRRASAAMWTRMRKEVQGRGSEPPQKARAGQPERGRPGPAGARPTPTGRPSSGAGGPYGSSERPVADRPAADGRSHSPADSRPARLRAEAPATAVPANAPASAGPPARSEERHSLETDGRKCCGGSGEWRWPHGWCAAPAPHARKVQCQRLPRRTGERLRQHVPPRDAGVDSWAAGSRGKPPGGWCDRDCRHRRRPGGDDIAGCRGDSLMLCSVKTVAVSCETRQENQHTFV